MRRNLTGLFALISVLAVLLVTVTIWQGSESSSAAVFNSIAAPDTTGIPAGTSIALDSSGNPVISYLVGNDVKVAVCSNPNCTAATVTTVDTLTDTGNPVIASLTLDASDNPVVSYNESSPQELKILHCGNPTCTSGNSISTPNPAGGGRQSSLELDGSGFPVVAYETSTSAEVRVLHCNDPNCTGGGESTSSISVGGEEESVDLTLDGSGFPVITYRISPTLDLEVLHCNDVDCAGSNESLENPDTGGDVGLYSSVQVDGSGFPVISYYDATNDDLKVMHCNDADCAGSDEDINMADTAGDVGRFTSFQLDGSGNPVVSYYDVSNSALKVLRCNDPVCDGTGDSAVTVDADGFVGTWTSLALDGSGNPVVGYADTTATDLNVLHCGKPNCIGTLPTFTVDSTSDTVDINIGNGICEDASGDCTLRAAIQESNALGGKQIIDVPAGTYAITIAGTGEDAGATGDFDIIGDLTINGIDFNVVIEGNGADRVFHVVSGVFVTNAITITGGGGVEGAGILNQGTAVLGPVVGVTIRGNNAVGAAGGIGNLGTMLILNSTISGNSADGDGGGIVNITTLSIANSTISGNSTDADGGGIRNALGSLTMNNVTISNNTADADASAGGAGGGIFTNSDVDLSNTLVTRNVDNGSGPDCFTFAGDLNSDGYNFIEDDTGCSVIATTGDQIATGDVSEIHTLQDNGGGILTHAIPSSSPAIDAGNPAVPGTGYPACELVEQRIIVARPIDGDLDGVARCDIGAFEASNVEGAGCPISDGPPPLQGCDEYDFTTTNLSVDFAPLSTPALVTCTATGQASIERGPLTAGALDEIHVDIKSVSGYIDCPGGFYDGSSIPNEGTFTEQVNTTAGLDFPLDAEFSVCIIADTYPYGFLRNCPDSGASKDPLILTCKVADLANFDCSVSSPSTFYNASPVPTPIADLESGDIGFDIIPTPTKQAGSMDTDGDSCTDAQENGGTAVLGGLRNFKNFWDFYDTDTENGANAGTELQGTISLSDVLAVAGRFGLSGDPTIHPLSDTTSFSGTYHTRFDRGALVGASIWNRGPADGTIALSDVLASANQFGHECS